MNKLYSREMFIEKYGASAFMSLGRNSRNMDQISVLACDFCGSEHEIKYCEPFLHLCRECKQKFDNVAPDANSVVVKKIIKRNGYRVYFTNWELVAPNGEATRIDSVKALKELRIKLLGIEEDLDTDVVTFAVSLKDGEKIRKNYTWS